MRIDRTGSEDASKHTRLLGPTRPTPPERWAGLEQRPCLGPGPGPGLGPDQSLVPPEPRLELGLGPALGLWQGQEPWRGPWPGLGLRPEPGPGVWQHAQPPTTQRSGPSPASRRRCRPEQSCFPQGCANPRLIEEC